MKTRQQTLLACALGAIALTTTSATSQILFSDTFSRTNGNTSGPVFDSDWGSNDNGLGGSIVQTYATSPDRLSGGVQQTVNLTQGVLRFGSASTTYDLYTDSSVLGAKGYRLQFNFTRLTAAGFVGVFFGAQPTAVSTKDANAAFGPINVLADYAGTVEAAFLLQNNANVGRVQKFSFGVQQGGNIDNAYDDLTTGTIGQHLATIDVTTLTSFASGETATFSLSIDGNFVTSHSALLDGGLGSFGFTSNQGSASSGGLIDNVTVSLIPEPTSAALLGLGALGFALRRNRKN